MDQEPKPSTREQAEQREVLPSYEEWLAAELAKNPDATELKVPVGIIFPNGQKSGAVEGKPTIIIKSSEDGRWYIKGLGTDVEHNKTLGENKEWDRRRAGMRERARAAAEED